MKSNIIRAILGAFALAFASLFAAPAMAFDNTGNVGRTDGDSSASFFAYMSTGVSMCGTGSTSKSYIDATDAGYKLWVDMLMTAKLTGASVIITTALVGSNCHIVYVALP